MIPQASLLTLLCCLAAAPFAFGQLVDTPAEKGRIENGYKVGVWEYYDSPYKNTPSLKVDYTENVLLFIEPDSSDYTVKLDGTWQSMPTEQHPRYIGSLSTFYETLFMNIEYPQEALGQRQKGKTYLYFEVDSLGKAGNLQAFSETCSSCAEEVKRAFALLPNYWVAAKVDGRYVPASFILPVDFQLAGDKKKAVPQAQSAELPKARMLAEVVVVGYGAPESKKISGTQKKEK